MLLLPLLVACQTSGDPSRAPDIVLISLDTTRADAIGAYADALPWRTDLADALRPSPSTPTVDALAARGVRMAWALAQAPTTLASHTSVLTGLDAYGHGVTGNGATLPADLPLLTERLDDAGYDTVGVIGAMVLGASTGFSRGFDVFVEPDGGRRGGQVAVPAAQVTDAALAEVAATADDHPLFLFAHYYDAHSPWLDAPSEVRARLGVDSASAVDGSSGSIRQLEQQARRGKLADADAVQARALYLAEVAAADAEVGRLLDGLSAHRDLDRTIVVIMGDHGETLDERSTTSPYSHGPDVDLVDIHVPLIVAGPGLPVGRVVQRPVRLQDLAPTLLGFAGLPAIGAAEDLGPVLQGTRAPDAAPSFATASQPQGMRRGPDGRPVPAIEHAVVHEGRLLIRTAGPRGGDRLYALAVGQPSVDDPTVRTRLSALLDAWEESAPTKSPPPPPPQRQEQLRSLGYVE